jgi:hypothetical protein
MHHTISPVDFLLGSCALRPLAAKTLDLHQEGSALTTSVYARVLFFRPRSRPISFSGYQGLGFTELS